MRGTIVSGLCWVTLAGAAAAPPGHVSADTGNSAVMPFVGRMTSNTWQEVGTLVELGFRDANLAGLALSRDVFRARGWSLEAEGQLVKHTGGQDHWEFNALLTGRWTDGPWSTVVPGSLAFGLGPSYATEVPPIEVALKGDSDRLLLYWTAEIEVGPFEPKGRLSAVARLHHRSNAFGALADAGGSNAVVLGLRWRF